MSSQKPTDFDHELIQFVKWIRENYTSDVWNGKQIWSNKGHGLFPDEWLVSEYKEFKQKINAKH